MLGLRNASYGGGSTSAQSTREVDIVIDGHDGSNGSKAVHSYTTLDKISGHARIRCSKDTPFQELDITFEGVVDTCTDTFLLICPVRSNAGQIFPRKSPSLARY